jgi:hypothetical protein
MCNSLLKEFRFSIGEQYELNEFNLKALESTFSNGLENENYEYIKGDFRTLFGVSFCSNPILQYNGDILSRIVYSFDIKDLGKLQEKLCDYLLITDKFDLGQTFTVFSFPEFSLMLDIEKDIKLRVFKILGQT